MTILKRMVPKSTRICGTQSGLQAAEEVPFVEVVLEGFAAVEEDDGDFVVEALLEFGVGVDVDDAESEVGAGGEAGELVLDHVAEVAALATVDGDLVGHEGDGTPAETVR